MFKPGTHYNACFRELQNDFCWLLTGELSDGFDLFDVQRHHILRVRRCSDALSQVERLKES